MHEIEDAMFARIEPGNECRPGDRTLWRVGCFEMGVTAALPQPRQVREVRPVPLDERRVHAVNSNDDDSFVLASAAAGKQSQCDRETPFTPWQ